ncbi:hypothetical protein AF72_09770 [Xylella taiwanensis]|uniref:Uncharacterized protein n=1 Tax=Xylella taiwanensis TaxID=1444770 RepID=Z9JH05_9GAMM|nr:hypothetical protein AF72_09770 [Xylella taiwanensis]
MEGINHNILDWDTTHWFSSFGADAILLLVILRLSPPLWIDLLSDFQLDTYCVNRF